VNGEAGLNNELAARVVAGAGAVLAIVGIFLDAIQGGSYWDFDGTVAWVGLVLGAAALFLVIAGYVRRGLDAWLFAIGAWLVGFWAWFPAVTAFDDWDETRAGMWLCLGGAALVVAGTGASLVLTGAASTTPAGISVPALVAGLGIVLVFPGIFLHAEQDTSYWNGPLGHTLGILMLALAVVSLAAWAATAVGVQTRGLDSAITLVLLGLVAFDPVGSAFNSFDDLQAGAWLALAGGILAAGGTWSARGAESPRVVTTAV
jgi:hypothetical protein